MDARVERHHRLPERALRGVGLITALGLALSGAACTLDEAAYQAALPSTASSASIEWRGERVGYLDVVVDTAGKRLRFFLPASNADCVALRSSADEVDYANRGILGELESGTLRCEPVGILSLNEWRSRRPRGSREPVPRARANWSVIHRDSELVLARGRFPLAGELGWVGGVDTVAVFAADAACAEVLESGVGSLEYRHAGQDVLAILASDRRCPVLGLVRPLP
jgi:hypothetical protein